MTHDSYSLTRKHGSEANSFSRHICFRKWRFAGRQHCTSRRIIPAKWAFFCEFQHFFWQFERYERRWNTSCVNLPAKSGLQPLITLLFVPFEEWTKVVKSHERFDFVAVAGDPQKPLNQKRTSRRELINMIWWNKRRQHLEAAIYDLLSCFQREKISTNGSLSTVSLEHSFLVYVNLVSILVYSNPTNRPFWRNTTPKPITSLSDRKTLRFIETLHE